MMSLEAVLMHQWVETGGQMLPLPCPELGQCEARVILCPEDSASIAPRSQCLDNAPFFGFPPSISWNQLLTPDACLWKNPNQEIKDQSKDLEMCQLLSELVL